MADDKARRKAHKGGSAARAFKAHGKGGKHHSGAFEKTTQPQPPLEDKQAAPALAPHTAAPIAAALAHAAPPMELAQDRSQYRSPDQRSSAIEPPARASSGIENTAPAAAATDAVLSVSPPAAERPLPSDMFSAAPAPVAPQPALAPQPDVAPQPAVAPTPPETADSIFAPRAPTPDFERLAANTSLILENATKAMTAMLKPLQQGKPPAALSDEVSDAVRTLGKVAEYWISDPRRAMQAQTAINTKFVEIWGNAFRRMTGEAVAPVIPADPRDKRFADPEWKESPLFDFLRQSYQMTVDWAQDLVARHEALDELTRAKAAFYVRQIAAALAPSNFLGTNPELLRATFKEDGENLVRGLRMLAEDIEAGKGALKLRQSDSTKFKLGVNMAVTPGKVVFRNDLIELIQYEPTTPQVYKRPLLIVPPWINKFYILDLNAEKSFIKWAVGQGLTVFVISWVNPDARHADKGFEEYMREGVFTALDTIEVATGERHVTSIGYCVGGTLLATTLAYMAATGDDRIDSVTFFTTQVDFTDPGDLKVFTDDVMIKGVEAQMAEHGFLDGSRMANAFNMLRPNDLIWSYVVNNYLKGQAPTPFDLLTWNSDSTRMTRANHSFYLRECYLANNLAKGKMVVGGVTLDLRAITIPVYELAAKEDHIAPARSAYNGAKLLGGAVRFVMAGSGHIAGVVNPPGPKPKYQYWTGDAPDAPFEEWVKAAKETPGSWWPNWIEWIVAQAPEQVPARTPGGGKLEPLADAPGDYVRMKC